MEVNLETGYRWGQQISIDQVMGHDLDFEGQQAAAPLVWRKLKVNFALNTGFSVPQVSRSWPYSRGISDLDFISLPELFARRVYHPEWYGREQFGGEGRGEGGEFGTSLHIA